MQDIAYYYEISYIKYEMKITGFESNIQISKEIGERIKGQRIDIGLTQKQLANKAGVSLRTIVNVELGKEVKFWVILNILRAINLLSNVDILIPENELRPFDYLLMDKKRKRIKNINMVSDVGFKWGNDK